MVAADWVSAVRRQGQSQPSKLVVLSSTLLSKGDPGPVDDEHLVPDDHGSCKGPPPDCRRIVIRLRCGVKDRWDRRATSTGQTCLANVHANRSLTPSLQRMDRQQSVRWGEGAHKDHSRAGKAARRGRVAQMTATLTATAATNGYQQRPATAHYSRTIRANLAYVRPEKRTVHSSRTSRPGHRPLGATLGATGANDLLGFRTAMDNGRGRAQGHGPI